GSSLLGSAATQEPLAQSPTGRISQHATQSRDHYFEESVSQPRYGAFHRQRARHHEALGKRKITRCQLLTYRMESRCHKTHDVRFGSLADIAASRCDVRFTSKADMCSAT